MHLTILVSNLYQFYGTSIKRMVGIMFEKYGQIYLIMEGKNMLYIKNYSYFKNSEPICLNKHFPFSKKF
jgi:hypothetical protein